MNGLSLARCAALVVAGVVGLAGAASTATAQRTTPRPALGPTPTPPTPPSTPYPGATVIVDPRWYSQQPVPFPGRRHPGHPGAGGYPVSVPVYYPAAGGYAVYDTDGRPLWASFDPSTAPGSPPADVPAGATPDLSGSPYVVVDGGAMVVDFGNGDRRAVPSCAAVEKASTPDGQPRTVFYRPPAYALVLRAGQRGQVLGRPAAGARVCYTVDGYGRIVLSY